MENKILFPGVKDGGTFEVRCIFLCVSPSGNINNDNYNKQPTEKLIRS